MSITARLRPHVEAELAAARRSGDVAGSWRHLERAHVLSQPSPWLHTRVHAAMVAQGLRTADAREVIGQLVRLAVAGVGSAVGRVPVGNTGRARVPIAQPMPIDPELIAILGSAGAIESTSRA